MKLRFENFEEYQSICKQLSDQKIGYYTLCGPEIFDIFIDDVDVLPKDGWQKIEYADNLTAPISKGE